MRQRLPAPRDDGTHVSLRRATLCVSLRRGRARAPQRAKLALALPLLVPGERTIVFVRRKHDASWVKKELRKEGRSASDMRYFYTPAQWTTPHSQWAAAEKTRATSPRRPRTSTATARSRSARPRSPRSERSRGFLSTVRSLCVSHTTTSGADRPRRPVRSNWG